MRKILALTLGATVLMMGYVEGMNLLEQEQPGIGRAPGQPAGEDPVTPEHLKKSAETNESGHEQLGLDKSLPQREKISPISVKAFAYPPGATAAWDALHEDTRLLRTMLLNANKDIISKAGSALRSTIDQLVKSWCAALTTEASGQKALLPVAEDLLHQGTSRDAACLFEVGARILGVWDVYQTTWEQDNNLLPALAGILRCAAGHWKKPRARNAAAEVLVEQLTKGGGGAFNPANKELRAAAQGILFAAAKQVDHEDE